jgi:hypothetical protein
LTASSSRSTHRANPTSGAYGDNNQRRYLGHLGTGITDAMLRDLLAKLETIPAETSPFDGPAPREHERKARWVRPGFCRAKTHPSCGAEQRRGPWHPRDSACPGEACAMPPNPSTAINTAATAMVIFFSMELTPLA